MSEPFIGEITAFAFNFPPLNWAQCNGQSMPISSFTALFSLIGITFGGNGQTTFNLPDLRGRIPMGLGQGPGLTNRLYAQTGGYQTVTLSTANIPSHTHLVNADASPDPESVNPINNYISSDNVTQVYKKEINPALEAQMSPACVSPTGLGQAHENRQPALTLNFCIALQGVFPSRS